MAEFERGDVVSYENPDCPNYAGVGIVVKIGNPEPKWSEYSLWVEPLVVNLPLGHIARMDAPWRPEVWRKVGHIDLPTGEVP